ncbi:sh3 domain-containing protein [Diplodia corticola]|uniref:Sh3 domain-containing protein n=1 Tax=Diplodia corticola TaxID=236234 RepID=A0A1J9RB04_9PEZI|nr:sh3 domain-containing protein [Diplodia corticola]OJD29603.1 sh3 domain-containing protein [Diplodia corticola]
MSFRGIDQPRGLLHSSHATPPHLRPVVRSSGDISNQHSRDDLVTIKVSDLKDLTDIFNKEILSLREDFEMLKQGSWSVTIGAFHPPKQFDQSKVNATRQRLQNSSGLLGFLTNAAKQIEGSHSQAPAVQPPDQTQISSAKPDGFLNEGDNEAEQSTQSPCLPMHPDTPVPSTEDPSFTHMSSAGNWQPLAIRSLRPIDDAATATIPTPSTMQTFSWDFIRQFLLGKYWSPGFYYHPVTEGGSILPSRSYYILNASTDPYVPRSPAAHGAKLTAFFNPENPEDFDGDDAAGAFNNVPVFVSESEWAEKHDVGGGRDDDEHKAEVGGRKYVYMGMYSQLRLSDKLDYDRQMEHVPDAVKMYWAEQLADIARPGWVTDALMKAFMPRPEYEGPLPGHPDVGHEIVRKEVGQHIRDLSEWEEEARKKIGRLTTEKILQAFQREDSADPPGLRLWWEYLQCVGWDHEFYVMMVQEQQRWAEKNKWVKTLE